jgi:hypothetical protein
MVRRGAPVCGVCGRGEGGGADPSGGVVGTSIDGGVGVGPADGAGDVGGSFGNGPGAAPGVGVG